MIVDSNGYLYSHMLPINPVRQSRHDAASCLSKMPYFAYRFAL